MKAKCKQAIAAMAICATAMVATIAWAQPSPAQLQMQQQQQNQNLGGMIQSDNMRRCGNPNGCARVAPQGPSAAEVRAWHERERKVQAEIAKHKATPYYMAIAYDFNKRRIMWGGGFYSEKRAVEEALKGCKSSNCYLVATFANACGVVTEPDRGARSVEDFFVGVDPDDKKAAEKAIRACEAKHGNNQCSYWNPKTKHGMAFCAGYDYSVYGQH